MEAGPVRGMGTGLVRAVGAGDVADGRAGDQGSSGSDLRPALEKYEGRPGTSTRRAFRLSDLTGTFPATTPRPVTTQDVRRFTPVPCTFRATAPRPVTAQDVRPVLCSFQLTAAPGGLRPGVAAGAF